METRNENPTPWIATHPGTILKLELEERGISQKEFAEMLGIQKSHLNEIIRGKRALSPNVADKIEEVRDFIIKDLDRSGTVFAGSGLYQEIR